MKNQEVRLNRRVGICLYAETIFVPFLRVGVDTLPHFVVIVFATYYAVADGTLPERAVIFTVGEGFKSPNNIIHL
jgi:hypothetical protein